MRTVVFSNEDKQNPTKKELCCKCHVEHPHPDVLETNCPIYSWALRYLTYFKTGPMVDDVRVVDVRFDYDFHYVNPDRLRDEAFAEMVERTRRCPFNAAINKVSPTVDASCLKFTLNPNMVTVYDVTYGGMPTDMPKCQCNLGVESFGVFREHCPACKTKLAGDPELSQYYICEDERCIDVKIDVNEKQKIDDCIKMSQKNVEAIKAAACHCQYNRCAKTK